VSDTFGSALWVLDFLWKLAYAGCAGVNMETGVNQLGFVSLYSPIADNSAKPEYYGLLAFAHAGRGQRVVLVQKRQTRTSPPMELSRAAGSP
jgi:hypothetical protein